MIQIQALLLVHEPIHDVGLCKHTKKTNKQQKQTKQASYLRKQKVWSNVMQVHGSD